MCLCVRAHSCYFRQSAGGRMNKAGKNYTKPRDRRYCCTEAILLVREKNMQKIIHWKRKQSETCDCGTMLAVRLFSSPLSSLPSFPLVDGGRGSGSVDTDADTFKIIAFAFRITRQHKQSYFFFSLLKLCVIQTFQTLHEVTSYQNIIREFQLGRAKTPLTYLYSVCPAQ